MATPKTKFRMINCALVFTGALAMGDPSSTNEPALKLIPKPPPSEAEVIVEWFETLDECEEDKICVQGQLHNIGVKKAANVRLRVELGGTKLTKPRALLHMGFDSLTMAPGDRQEFFIRINRKVPYRDKGKDKVLEVGKYNFKLVPVWNQKKSL